MWPAQFLFSCRTGIDRRRLEGLEDQDLGREDGVQDLRRWLEHRLHDVGGIQDLVHLGLLFSRTTYDWTRALGARRKSPQLVGLGRQHNARVLMTGFYLQHFVTKNPSSTHKHPFSVGRQLRNNIYLEYLQWVQAI